MPPRRTRNEVPVKNHTVPHALGSLRSSIHVVVLVLGDIGRSPRMQYHALSLARYNPNINVSLVGYAGERCISAIEDHERISIHHIKPFTSNYLREKSFLLFAAIKILVSVFQLFHLLLIQLSAPHYILVQNPPSIPTLIIVWIVSLLRGSIFIIDWHNLGFSVLSHSKGPKHPLVRIARIYERWVGRQAQLHFSVTDAMRLWLSDNFGVKAHVLYDRPPSFFGSTSPPRIHDLFCRLAPQLQEWRIQEQYERATSTKLLKNETLFTKGAQGGRRISLRETRPALLVSSTSWTEDEDFATLLHALEILDKKWNKKGTSNQPDFLVVVVTGKGPQKAMYEKQMRSLNLRKIGLCTMWLEAEDYPVLIGAADVGVCLHTSTSGLDLPMKVLDMFGCNVPVCAVGFSCLHELVRHRENGLVFKTSLELADYLNEMLVGFPDSARVLERLRGALQGMPRWEENWLSHAAPVIFQESPPTTNKTRFIALLILMLLFIGVRANYIMSK